MQVDATAAANAHDQDLPKSQRPGQQLDDIIVVIAVVAKHPHHQQQYRNKSNHEVKLRLVGGLPIPENRDGTQRKSNFLELEAHMDLVVAMSPKS